MFYSILFFSEANENSLSGAQETQFAKYTQMRDSLGIKAVSKVS